MLLLASVVIFLAAAKTAATLHRRLPSPNLQQTPRDDEAAWTRSARWAVAALCVVLAGVVIALSINMRSEGQLPAPIASAAGDSTDVADVVSPAKSTYPGPLPKGEGATTAAALPSDEQVGESWPRFRGPGGLGISAYANVPDAWDAKSGKGIVWKTPVPLPGNNSPVVWGNRVFLSGADQQRREVYCFDADSGKLLWQQEVPGTPQSTARPPKVNEDTGYAAPTTATDGRRVFAIFANGDVAAFDFAGKLVWAKSLGLPENNYGHASSLAMYENLLLVQFDQGTTRTPKSKLLALDSATGKTVWEVAARCPTLGHADRDPSRRAATRSSRPPTRG